MKMKNVIQDGIQSPAQSGQLDFSQMLTRHEIARKLDCSARHIDSLLAKGIIKRYKIGHKVRVHPDDLAAYVASCKSN